MPLLPNYCDRPSRQRVERYTTKANPFHFPPDSSYVLAMATDLKFLSTTVQRYDIDRN